VNAEAAGVRQSRYGCHTHGLTAGSKLLVREVNEFYGSFKVGVWCDITARCRLLYSISRRHVALCLLQYHGHQSGTVCPIWSVRDRQFLPIHSLHNIKRTKTSINTQTHTQQSIEETKIDGHISR